jgi:hypothetical protein
MSYEIIRVEKIIVAIAIAIAISSRKAMFCLFKVYFHIARQVFAKYNLRNIDTMRKIYMS